MIEQVARASAEELRTGTTGDVEAGLADLHVRQAQHRRRSVVVAAATVALALGLGWSAGWLMARSDAEDSQLPVKPGPSQVTEEVCHVERVTCLGGGVYRFALHRPVDYAPPPGFGVASGGGVTPGQVESYRQAGPTAGITVLERAHAASLEGTFPARGVGAGPQAFVDWVATRPFLDAGKVTTTTIDGQRAWQVRVVLAHDAAAGAATCNVRYRCHAITYQRDEVPTGIWGNMAAEYTALRLPGGGTTVVWSWIFSGDRSHLGALDEAVQSLSWPPG